MDEDLSLDDVKMMPLDQFEKHFGFRPIDALEKKWFVVTGGRLNDTNRKVLEAGILGEYNLDGWIME